MSNSRTIAEGETILHAHGSAVVRGQGIPIGQMIGVAASDYGSGVTGVYYIEGVHELLGVNSATYTIGRAVQWDASASAFANHSLSLVTGDVSNACVAMETKTLAGSGTNYIKAKINVALGTIT